MRALDALPPGGDAATSLLRSAILVDAAHAASGAGDPARALDLLGAADVTKAPAELVVRYWLGHSEVAQWNGRFELAKTMARHARAEIANMPASRQARLLTIESYDLEAEARYYAGDLRGALAQYRQAERLAAAAERTWPEDRRVRWKAARERWSLGTTLVEANQPVRALPLLRAALASADADADADPADQVTGRRQRVYMLALGQALARAQMTQPGLAMLRRSVRLREEWWRLAPNDPARRRDWTTGVAAIGDTLAQAGQIVPACRFYERALRSMTILASRNKLTRLEQGAGARDLDRHWQVHCEKHGRRSGDQA